MNCRGRQPTGHVPRTALARRATQPGSVAKPQGQRVSLGGLDRVQFCQNRGLTPTAGLLSPSGLAAMTGPQLPRRRGRFCYAPHAFNHTEFRYYTRTNAPPGTRRINRRISNTVNVARTRCVGSSV